MTTRWPRRCGFALPSSSGCLRKQAKTYGKHTVNRNGTWRRERGHAFLRLAGGGGVRMGDNFESKAPQARIDRYSLFIIYLTASFSVRYIRRTCHF
jgi:hypothetical protein